MGLDYGDKTIGVAVSLNGRVATGVRTLRRKDAVALRPCLKELKVIIREHEISHVVLGYPKKMGGEESTRCEATLAFKEKLERYVKSVSVTLWDERLSTRAVSRGFEGSRKKYKQHVDEMAAIYILQGYLDYINIHGKESLEKNMDNDFDNDDAGLVLTDENGEERPLLIRSSKEDAGEIYLLAVDTVTDEVIFLRCEAAEDDEEEFEIEQIEEGHANYKRVFEMFKDDYDELI